MILKDDNGNELPKDVQDRVNNFVDNLKNVPWLKPPKDLKREEVDKQVNFTMECFGVKAGIEYKKITKKEDWDSAWDSARVSAWDSAWDSALDSAWASARDSALDSARASAWASARDSAWASAEIIVDDNDDFKKKYPNGAFKQLFKLWEMGLYPAGILRDTGKFTVYIPPSSMEFPDDFND